MKGERLGRYQIERELGAGGMGTVWLASDGDDRVAVKVVHPHLMEQAGFFKRFLREAQAGRSVEHENVVRTLDCDAVGGHHFLVMEYVEGQTLAELQAELERVPEELCRHVGREICKGLAAIHDAGVVHRDLKPENVLITPDHVVKVMDLGVAQLADEQMRLSQTGAFVGSVEYAAPEQFEGVAVDHRCDLHALGLLLYELACGRHPYRGDDFRGVMKRVCEEAPRRAGEVNPQLSAFFEEVVHTLLAKSADERFGSAAEALAVLEEGEDSDWWHERARQLQATTKRPLRRIRIPRETAVYGRDEELSKLRALYDAAKAGDGRVVLIEGEAGIGKSRLVDELVGRLQADGEDLNFLFGSYPPGGAATAAGGFSSAYREQFGESGSASYLSETPLLVPAFDAVLRGEPSPDGVTALTNDSLGTCFVHATRALAAERTTVVLIDDLHFAPEEARALFTAVARAVPGHRVLLFGTFRPGVPEGWVANITRLDHATRLELARLGPKDLGTLLEDAFASRALADELGHRIAMKSDGNPFFAFEIIRGLREGQLITQRDDGTWASTQVIEEIQIPSSVRDLVNARVANLTEEERDLLDVASCCGYEFDALLVGEVVGTARIPVLKRFAQIERQHRLVHPAGRRFVFDHHQVQEALYDSLPALLREEYHATIAEVLETNERVAQRGHAGLDGGVCVEICRHHLAGGRGQAALCYLEHAQAHLEGGHLHAESIALGERALTIEGLLVGADRARALLRLASGTGPLYRVGRTERQLEAAQEAARLAESAADDELRRRAHQALGSAFYAMSRYDDAEVAIRRALELAAAHCDDAAELRARINLCLVLMGQHRDAEAERELVRALDRARGSGVGRLEARAAGTLGVLCFSQGRFQEAERHFAGQLSLSRRLGDLEGEAEARVNLGNVYWALGRIDEAMACHEGGLATFRELGHRRGEAHARGCVANGLNQQGRLAQAIELYEQDLALSREFGHREGEAVALVNLGLVSLRLGDRSGARTPLVDAVSVSREIGNRYVEGYGLHGLSQLADEQGDPARALTCCERALALRREIGHGDGVAESLLLLGELHLRGGRGSAARAAIEEALNLSRDQGRSAQAALGAALLAGTPGGDGEAAAAAVEETAESGDLPRIRLLLWGATGDRAHLAAAKRHLEELLAKNPPAHHESMCANVRVHREILAAWQAEFGDEGPDEAAGGGSEAATQAG